MRCHCKAVIDVPETSPAQPQPTAPAETCPQCASPLSAQAVLCIHCGYNLRDGGALKTQVQADADTATGSRIDARLWLKNLGMYVGMVAVIAVFVGVLHGFSPYLDQVFGDSRWARQRAERLLEEYDLFTRIMRGTAFGAVAGAIITLVVAARKGLNRK